MEKILRKLDNTITGLRNIKWNNEVVENMPVFNPLVMYAEKNELLLQKYKSHVLEVLKDTKPLVDIIENNCSPEFLICVLLFHFSYGFALTDTKSFDNVTPDGTVNLEEYLRETLQESWKYFAPCFEINYFDICLLLHELVSTLFKSEKPHTGKNKINTENFGKQFITEYGTILEDILENRIQVIYEVKENYVRKTGNELQQCVLNVALAASINKGLTNIQNKFLKDSGTILANEESKLNNSLSLQDVKSVHLINFKWDEDWEDYCQCETLYGLSTKMNYYCDMIEKDMEQDMLFGKVLVGNSKSHNENYFVDDLFQNCIELLKEISRKFNQEALSSEIKTAIKYKKSKDRSYIGELLTHLGMALSLLPEDNNKLLEELLSPLILVENIHDTVNFLACAIKGGRRKEPSFSNMEQTRNERQQESNKKNKHDRSSRKRIKDCNNQQHTYICIYVDFY
ncbi:unnamed protein product [Mytilus edulis]|uniref:Uncharacterized protein n=1 Tax=Mytilus edulis TaxID=6550 RepID=A0A8S3RVW5_MYTED|nr:unnamed protein product [Mytilus edulis]